MECFNKECPDYNESSDSNCRIKSTLTIDLCLSSLIGEKAPVAKLHCSDWVSLTYTLDRLLLEARGVAKVLADNAKHDLNLDTADYWYDIEEQILSVYSDLQKSD